MGLSLVGDGRVRFVGKAPPDLLARLRQHKTELVELLTGHACHHCGATLDARLTGALAHDDDTAAHVACHERAEVDRYHARAAACFSPGVLADEAELTMRGEPLP